MSQLPSNRLPLWCKLGYAVGGLGTDLAFNAITFYLIFYLTSIAGIPPATAGVLAGVPKILLGPLDPIVGALSDRVHSRLGRRRLFLIVSGPLSGLFFAMQFFAPPSWEVQTLTAFWWVVQFAYTANFSLLIVSYNALEAELSSSSTERMQLVSMRQGFGILGALIGSALTLIIVGTFGGGRMGFAGMGAIFGALVASSYLTVVATTPAEQSYRENPLSFWKEARLTLRLKPFWLQLGVTSLVTIATVVANATIIFYIDYVHGLANLIPLAMLVAMAGALTSLPGWNWLTRRWDNRQAFVAGLAIQVATLLSLRFVPERNMALLWPLTAMSGVGSAAISIFPRAMLTDVVAYDRARQGRSRAGNIVGLWGLGNRAGLAVGSALVGWLLVLVGYSSGIAVTPQLQEGLRTILGYVPSAFLLATIPLLALYPLSRAEMSRVEASLSNQTRNSQAPNRRPA